MAVVMPAMPAAAAHIAIDVRAGGKADDAAGDEADRAEHQRAGARPQHAVEGAIVGAGLETRERKSQSQRGDERFPDHEAIPCGWPQSTHGIVQNKAAKVMPRDPPPPRR